MLLCSLPALPRAIVLARATWPSVLQIEAVPFPNPCAVLVV